MTWIAVPVPPEEVTAEMLFDLGRKHRLIPENTALALDNYTSLCHSCAVIKVQDSHDGADVATVIISGIVDGEQASVDFVPVSKYFAPVGKNGEANDDPFLDKIEAALNPLFVRLLKGRKLRRLNAEVPASRCRTFKAMRQCGFKKEGVKRDAVKFAGKEAEDLVIMGMLAPKE